MKSFTFRTLIVLAASFTLPAQLTVPQIGVAHYSDGSLHIIRGLAANFIVGRLAIAAVDRAAFSDSAGLTAAHGLIRLVQPNGDAIGEYPSEEPLPVLHIDAGPQSAMAWLPSKHVLLRWHSDHFSEIPVDDSSFGGQVAFLNLTSNDTAQFFVTRPDASVERISVSLPSGSVTSSDTEPTAHGWVFLHQGWTLSEDESGLIAQLPSGNRQTIQLSKQALPSGDLTLEQMSNHWLHVSSRSTHTNWALYLDASKISVFLLPPPVAEAAQ